MSLAGVVQCVLHMRQNIGILAFRKQCWIPGTGPEHATIADLHPAWWSTVILLSWPAALKQKNPFKSLLNKEAESCLFKRKCLMLNFTSFDSVVKWELFSWSLHVPLLQCQIIPDVIKLPKLGNLFDWLRSNLKDKGSENLVAVRIHSVHQDPGT